MTYRLVLLRHGESEWNKANLFTGWYDADLTEAGENEAVEGGRLLADREILPDIVHTSVQTRAIRTANLTLDVIGRLWIPVRRSWRLNERHYGDLQGKNKAETAEQYGLEQVQIWRRAYATPPPPLDPTDERSARHDPRYALLPPELVPSTECLRDVLERMLPYWFDSIVPDLQTGATVMVAAHGNSLRALVKHLDGISDEAITSLNIPTGQPLVYELDVRLRPIEDKPVDQRYLLSADEIQERAEAVAKQAGG